MGDAEGLHALVSEPLTVLHVHGQKRVVADVERLQGRQVEVDRHVLIPAIRQDDDNRLGQ